MGFFSMNISGLDITASGLSKQWFQVLMIIAFFLICNLYPKAEDWKKYLYIGLQVLGVLILVSLAYFSKEELSPGWWGILGLIGWTYLISAPIYLFARKSAVALLESGSFSQCSTLPIMPVG